MDAYQNKIPRSADKGVALISVMLIVTIVVSITAYMAYQQQLWIRQVENISLRAQSESIRYSAAEWISILLKQDSDDQDDLTEAWATNYPTLPVENGLVAAKVTDGQGRFNLNNMIKENGDPSPNDIGVFQRLLDSQGLNPNMADAVLDWLDANPNQSAHGAEDLFYMNLEQPYRTANRQFNSVEELRLVSGFSHEAVNKLRGFLSALPQRTTLNINTVSAPLFAAMFPELRTDFIDDLVKLQESSPFEKKSDLAKHLPNGQPPPLVGYDIKTKYFLVTIHTEFGRLRRDAEVLIFRPGGNKEPEILWQSQVPLILLPKDKNNAEKQV